MGAEGDIIKVVEHGRGGRGWPVSAVKDVGARATARSCIAPDYNVV